MALSMIANDLQLGRMVRSQCGVTISRARASLLPFLLAFVALLGMNALSLMHNISPHDDQHTHIVSIDDHDHGDEGKSDPDSTVHLAMHAIVHGVDLPASGEVQIVQGAVIRSWAIVASPVFQGFDTASLLRPPQA